MPNIQTQLSEHYISGLSAEIAPGTSLQTEHGTVRHMKGRVSSVGVTLPNGDTIDFSQDVDGNAEPGWIERTRIPGHDDERTEDYRERVMFPQSEGDIEFMDKVLQAAQEYRQDQVA